MAPHLSTPSLSATAADALRTALLAADYTTDGVQALLGRDAHAALGRGEPEAAHRRSLDGGALGALVRLFLLGAVEPGPAVTAALSPLSTAEAQAAGLLRPAGEGFAATLDLRPYADDSDGTDPARWWVFSDLDTPARNQDRDHVTGVGAASLTLASATLRTPTGSVLDLGTGCGVQALHASRHARTVTATDVTSRARALAAATFALSRVDVELLDGPWLDPVAGRRFDRIVSNPPFVPGPARLDYVYPDPGEAGDAALARLVGALPAHLEPGGVAQLLGSWLHVAGQDWPDRVRGWLPEGVDAWIVQREVADPALHVGTWQRDAGIDPVSPLGRARAAAWLDWMDAERVEAVGFGFLLLRRPPADTAATVVVEDLTGESGAPRGHEVAGWLDRIDWLRAHPRDQDLLRSRLTLASTAVLERYAVPGTTEDAWHDAGATLTRTDGPGWRHQVDAPAVALLAGCRGDLPLEDLFALLALAHDRPVDALTSATLPAVRELVRHGLLLPPEPR